MGSGGSYVCDVRAGLVQRVQAGDHQAARDHYLARDDLDRLVAPAEDVQNNNASESPSATRHKEGITEGMGAYMKPHQESWLRRKRSK